MPEWLSSFSRWVSDAFPKDGEIALDLLARRMVMALILGIVVAGIYRLTHRKEGGRSSELITTLVMLTVLIAMVTLVIGRNFARAFSLVGLLGVVRFRTVMEDTRDTAFVVFAVAVGLALGGGYLKAPLLCIPITAAAALIFRPRTVEGFRPSRDFVLILRVGVGHTPEGLFRDPFAQYVERFRLTAAATARQGAALDYTYRVRLRPRTSPAALVAALNAVEGAQNVELRQA
jgi:hypothetical protein